MKKQGILNPALNEALSRLGHGHLVAIADCGLPLPASVPVVDLALVMGIPRFKDMLNAVLADIAVEAATIAIEADGGPVADWVRESGPEPAQISHEELKALLPQCRLIIRTGEATPYANVILRCGVPF